jgi:integrase
MEGQSMSGHIRRRGERSWELKFDLGRDPVTGKREIRYHSFRGTKRQAQAELTGRTADVQRGNYVEVTTETVGGFMNTWARDVASLHVTPKTLERYNELIKNQVQPHIGHRPIQKLRPIELTNLYATLIRDGLAPRTVGHVHRLLHRAFCDAVTSDILTKNIVSSVNPPKVPEEEIEIVREDGIKPLLQKLRDRPLYMITTLALATGMRRGELLALRWQDVDLDGGSIGVERSLEETRAGLRFKSPKTKKGRRTITIPPSIVAKLRAHRKDQQEHRLAIGAGKAPADALVFPAWNGSPRSPHALTKEWRLVMTETGMEVSFHALRHTHASSMIAAGVDVLTISRRLGHASASITLDIYGHLFKNTDDRAAQAVEALFGKVGGAK